MNQFHLFPPDASTAAQQIDRIFFSLTALTFLVCAIVFLPIIFFSVKLVEVTWTTIPIFIAMGFFAWGAEIYFYEEVPPRDALEINVIGKQWMWKAQHQEGNREINELHVPVGRPVKLTLASEDVIHSFFVPAFRVKQDVVPGKYTGEWFKPTRTGEYHLFCSQYCGTDHSRMIGRVVVMEPAEYERWLNTGESTQSITLAGERLFRERGCSGCHSVNSKFHAPLLEGFYGKSAPLETGELVAVNERYVRDSILLPGKEIAKGYQNIMPSYAGQLSEEEIMQLIAYLKSIGNQNPEEAGATPPSRPAEK